MTSRNINISNKEVPKFHRQFFNSDENFSVIGDGSLGGKASGLVAFQSKLINKLDRESFSSLTLKVPKFVIIATDNFEHFMKMNNLYEIALSEISDEKKAKAFQNAEMPIQILGDLRTISSNFHTPLAIRSSSMLEDSLDQPFAGVYSTKMIANNEPSEDKRFHKLVEAIKFVYSSAFFKSALQYFESTGHNPRDERMAVIIQEVIGTNRNKRFYPAISGVARSYNYYPFGRSKAEDGVVNLALGLGKTIVDGGISWSYNPKFPKIAPPFANAKELMKNSQSEFWAVNMQPIHEYDPLHEAEYMTKLNLTDADYDSAIDHSASTFDTSQNKIVMGTGVDGARIIDFQRLLKLNEFNFNELIPNLLEICEEALQIPVEIEFAFDIDKRKEKYDFAVLQVRPMNVSTEVVDISDDELDDKKLVVKTNEAMGNGESESVADIIFVDPKKFESKFTKVIAGEIEIFNKKFVDSNKNYVLIGFGRWGSSDEWLGIPVDWSMVSKAKVIVESSLPNFNIDFSQGSHFFHNISAFEVFYFSVKQNSGLINWDWLTSQKFENESEFVKHIKLEKLLKIKVDGRKGTGIIRYE